MFMRQTNKKTRRNLSMLRKRTCLFFNMDK